MKTIWIPQAAVSVALLWALYPHNPYGYYVLLRVLCCGAFAYLALIAFHRSMQGWVVVLSAVAFLYNPLIRFRLTRELWSVLNVLTVVVALVSIKAFQVRKAPAVVTKRE